MALVPADRRRRCVPGPRRPTRGWYLVGAMAEGDAAAEEALVAADQLGLDSAWSDTAVSQARARADADPSGAAAARRGAAAGTALGDADVEFRVLFNLATVAYEAGRIEESLTWSRRGTTGPGTGHRMVVLPGRAATLQVTALYVTGGWDASRRGGRAGAGAGDGRPRARRRPARPGRAGRPGSPRTARLGEGADPAGCTSTCCWASSPRPRRSTSRAWQGQAETALEVASAASRRLQEQWADDHLGVLRLVGSALSNT